MKTREDALCSRILAYLQEHKRLTAMEAVSKFGTTRLGARIFELRERGYDIRTIMTYTKDPITHDTYKYGTYVLRSKEDGDVLQTEESE